MCVATSMIIVDLGLRPDSGYDPESTSSNTQAHLPLVEDMGTPGLLTCVPSVAQHLTGTVANFTTVTTVLRACIFTSADTNQTQVPLGCDSQSANYYGADHEATILPCMPWDPKKFQPSSSHRLVVSQQSPETHFDRLVLVSGSKFETQSAVYNDCTGLVPGHPRYVWVVAWLDKEAKFTIPLCLFCS